MIDTVHPPDLLDYLDRPGYVIALVHDGDQQFLKYDELDSLSPLVRDGKMAIGRCLLETAEDAAIIQMCWVPQYRFYHNGGELAAHVGVLSSEAVAIKLRDFGFSPHVR